MDTYKEPVTSKSAGDVIKNMTTFGNQMEEIAEENSFKSDAISDSAFLSEGRQKRKSTAKS